MPRYDKEKLTGPMIDSIVDGKERFTLLDIIEYCKAEGYSALKTDINNHLRNNYEICNSSTGRYKTYKHISIGTIDLVDEYEEYVYKLVSKYIDPDITFGHEFELGSNVTGADLRDHINRYTTVDVVGTGTSYSGSSGSCDYSKFNITYDSTAGTSNHSKGFELLTPILKGKKGIKELKLFFNSLKILHNQRDGNGVRKLDTGRKNGGHVHFGFDHMNLQDVHIKNLVTLYINNFDIIKALFAEHRRSPSHNFTTLSSISHYVDSDGTVKYNSTNRTNAVNITHFRRRGTIEFRQKDSTFDFYDMSSWIIFVQYLVKYARADKPTFTADSLPQFCKNIGMESDLVDLMRVAIVRNNPNSWESILPSDEVELISNAKVL